MRKVPSLEPFTPVLETQPPVLLEPVFVGQVKTAEPGSPDQEIAETPA